MRDIHLDGFSVVMTIGIRVQNTSNQKLVIHSLAANVFTKSGGQSLQIGNVSLFGDPVPVNPNSQLILELDAKLSDLQIINDIILAFQNNSSRQQVTIKGSANVDTYQIPLDITFTVG